MHMNGFAAPVAVQPAGRSPTLDMLCALSAQRSYEGAGEPAATPRKFKVYVIGGGVCSMCYARVQVCVHVGGSSLTHSGSKMQQLVAISSSPDDNISPFAGFGSGVSLSLSVERFAFREQGRV